MLGKLVQLGGIGRTVVGVLPSGFAFPDNNFRSQLLVPTALPGNSTWRDERSLRSMRAIARQAAGLILGIAGPLAATRAIRSLLDGIQPNDPVAFSAAAVLFGIVAGAACLIPAVRASRVDPMVTLRSDHCLACSREVASRPYAAITIRWIATSP